jgi:pyruvate dehydrogenase E2 component (dihydrolipoamide acetyltransferase)
MSTFNLPDLGEGLQDAEIVAWHVAEGDHVVADEPLLSVETEKAVVEVPSPHSGYIKHILGKPHERVKVGAAIVEFSDEPHADTGTVVGDLGGQLGPAPAAPRQTPAPAAPTPAAGTASASSRIEVSPAVRALARQRGVDLATLTGTGPNGIITRADVERGGTASAAAPTGEAIALHGVRRSMAVNMAKAHAEVVPATVWDDADVEAWWSAHCDVTSRTIRAVAVACAAVPILNSWFDGAAMTLQTHRHIDLGVAVDLEGGLIVPVLRDVAGKDAAALRRELDALKTAVRARSVPVSELRNPTITLSNFGMLAGRHAALVVVPPQVAIIGTGRIVREAVPQDNGLTFRHRLPLSLTFDHRAATGGEGGRFLKAMIDDLQKAS